MLRRLFTVGSAISLGLFAGIVVAWVISIWWGFTLEWSTVGVTRWVALSRSAGEFTAAAGSNDPVVDAPHGWRFTWSAPLHPIADLERLQSPIARFRFRGGPFAVFTIDLSDLSARSGLTQVLWPCWASAGIAAILPAFWLRRWRRTVPPGHCAGCGYDLRASNGRCPECGALILVKMNA